ncbi:MAG: glycosyltransferase family 39 protein, partial [Chloroflexi bacterium]|nr:glycosyltransferase family 39 protein [Chloroflexota bacterium]
MEEPSVLDYLKSKLRFGRGGKIEIPAKETDAPAALHEPGTRQPEAPQLSTIKPALFQPKLWPWRSLLALSLAVLGQRGFDLPRTSPWTGLVFYIPALGMLLLAYSHGEWRLPGFRAVESSHIDPSTVRRNPLWLAVLLALAAFLAFGGNLFNNLNITLWLTALGFFLWAFWQRDPLAQPVGQRVKNFLTQRDWRITISRWTLLVLVVAGLVTFFRVYRIGGVPAEPFSDHAEKILDVYDITQGQTHIFFPRNTGREAIQMYWTVLVAKLFGTGLSFLSLKLGTALLGLLTLPYMYLLGKEISNRRVGLLAMFFMGIAYWPNVISRAGLRFPLYPLFVAPTLYYLLRGLRRQDRNDFILSGIFLGLGLHGYSPFRIVPFVVVIAVGLYLLHRQSKGVRKLVVWQLVVLALFSVVVFLPLGRYALEHPDDFSYRALSRLGSMEHPLPGPWWQIFSTNLWDALKMFNWDNGNIWVHSVPNRPALGVVSGALFLIGVLLLLARYAKERHWLDLFLLLSIPLLQLPSSLSLAYPAENPALNRAAGAAVPVFLVVALALDGLITGLGRVRSGRSGAVLAWGVTGVLLLLSISQNYDLVFNQYDR